MALEILQLPLSSMATYCYIVGDPETETCGVIDPAFDTDTILKSVSVKGWTITQIINTHCHSDHTAGNAAMKASTDADILIHALDAPVLNRILNRTFTRLLGGRRSPQPTRLLSDGDVIPIGGKQLHVLHTPGHTKGGICLYTEGHVFTGDSLFVGSVGRTDLPGGSLKELIQSVTLKLFTLPEETIVWPGHNYGPSPSSTIGKEKRTNPFFNETTPYK